jgi:enoyl-CoA hydratase
MPVRVSGDRAVAVLTIDRPDKLNALDYPTIDALRAHLDELPRDGGVRAIILTGAGDRAFTAGADIPDLAGSIAQGSAAALREIVARGHRLTLMTIAPL